MIPVHRMVIKSVVAVLVMGAFAYYFMNFNVILLVLLAAVVYIAMLLVLKTCPKEEIKMAKIIISSKKTFVE